MASNEIVALDPTSGPLDRKDPRAFPDRPETLNGAVVGLVANGLGEGQKMMDALYEELNKEAELVGAVRVLKRSVSIPPDPPDWERLVSEVTVAITGMGG